MRNAERGASQIPLVICIVLLLVAGFFAYSQHGDREAAENALAKIREAAKDPTDPAPPGDGTIINYITKARGEYATQRAIMEETVAAVGGGSDDPVKVIDPAKLRATASKFLDACDKGEFVVEFETDRFIESAGDIKVQAGAGKIGKQYLGTRELRGGKPDLTNILDHVVVPGMRAMVADIKRYRDAYSAAVAAKETAEAAYRKDLADKDVQIRQKGEEAVALEANKNQQINDLRRQLSDAEAAKAAAEEEKNKVVAALTAERNQLQADLARKSGEVQVLKDRRRLVETDTSPDGSILSVGEKQDFAVIDLGKDTNNLMPGANFDVYAIGKNGMEIAKGVIKVTKLDGDTSSCRVLEVFDPYNPIAPGDRIRSIFFNPKETVRVALIGRFTKMGKSDAARRLQSLGVIVDEKVSVHTTYLVVGAPDGEGQLIEENPEFKTAELYGIPRISERELSKFTMY
jgi:hypothetical protein